jgi:hypothetical protein
VHFQEEALATETNRYSAFISYRHMPRDRQWAMRIMRELETYRTPKALQGEAFPDRIGHLFRDEDEIPASTDLSDQIKDALARSDYLIVVCSPDTPASRWVRREIELFQEMGKSDRIMPLLIAGEPEESFPPELRRRRVAVVREDGGTDFVWEEVEPVAADVRPRKDESKGKTERRALLRLAAALLGCRFDDLARRDEERRRAKLRRQLGVGAAGAALAGLGGLWWWDANVRLRSVYCSAYAERFGVPQCVGQLDEASRQRLGRFYQLTQQGGRVLTMKQMNSSGTQVAETDSFYETEPWTDGVTHWLYAYATTAVGVEAPSPMSRCLRRMALNCAERAIVFHPMNGRLWPPLTKAWVLRSVRAPPTPFWVRCSGKGMTIQNVRASANIAYSSTQTDDSCVVSSSRSVGGRRSLILRECTAGSMAMVYSDW